MPKVRLNKKDPDLFEQPKSIKVRIMESDEPAGVVLETLATVIKYKNITEDLLLALRLSYYCDAESLVSDQVYDAIERGYMESGKCRKDSPLHSPGSDCRDHYYPHIRALALYMQFAAYHRASPEDSLRSYKRNHGRPPE